MRLKSTLVPIAALVLLWPGLADAQYGDPYNRSRLRVLLSLDPARTNMGVKWIRRTDNDFALAWVKSYGKGRVFNTSFGHRTALFWNPRLLRFYLDAIQFATGDLAAPTAPRKTAPVRNVPGTELAPDDHEAWASLGHQCFWSGNRMDQAAAA